MFAFSYGCYLRDVLPVEEISSNPRKLMISKELFSAKTLDEKMLSFLSHQEAIDLDWLNADPARSVFNWIFDGTLPQPRVYNLLYKSFHEIKTKDPILDFFEFQANTSVSNQYVEVAFDLFTSNPVKDFGFTFNDACPILIARNISVFKTPGSTDQEKKKAASALLFFIGLSTQGQTSWSKYWMLKSTRRKIRAILDRQNLKNLVRKNLLRAVRHIDEYQLVNSAYKSFLVSGKSTLWFIIPVAIIIVISAVFMPRQFDRTETSSELTTDSIISVHGQKNPIEGILVSQAEEVHCLEADWIQNYIELASDKEFPRLLSFIDSIVVSDPECFRGYIERSLLLLGMDKPNEALENITIGIKKYGPGPWRPRYYRLKSLILEELELYDEMFAVADSMIYSLPSSESDSVKSDAYLFRATLYQKFWPNAVKPLDSAIVDISRVLMRDPQNVEALYRRADLFMHNKQFTQAITDYETIISLPEFRTLRGNALPSAVYVNLARSFYLQAIDRSSPSKNPKVSLSLHKLCQAYCDSSLIYDPANESAWPIKKNSKYAEEGLFPFAPYMYFNQDFDDF